MALALILSSTNSWAAQHKDPANGCAVIAPRYLASSDYTFQYQGSCKDGLAEGKGKAIWTLTNTPHKQVVWEGAFSAGVYLPPPAGIVSAREWTGRNVSDTVFFDMGALPAQSGIPAARLKVMAASDLTNYPDPCAPRTMWVTNVPAQAMISESAAQSLLAAAIDKLKTRCGAKLAGPGSRQDEHPHLQVRAVSTPDLESDRYGNPGPVLAEAFIPLLPGDPIERYSNQAAAQQRQQQQQAEDQGKRQANVQRLRTFFETHKASSWTKLRDLAENPFRYTDRGVVVTAARVEVAVNPNNALLYAPDEDYCCGAAAELHGDVAQWKAGWRLLAVRVLGREDRSGGWTQLQLVGSEACTESRCEDWLQLPARLQDGQKP
ncbi:MAG: hypothetical protein FWF41_09975 [Betaproteobacteria bacterium]|nr:hypothetical protein [Betaproteobacteria bacterium]